MFVVAVIITLLVWKAIEPMVTNAIYGECGRNDVFDSSAEEREAYHRCIRELVARNQYRRGLLTTDQLREILGEAQ